MFHNIKYLITIILIIVVVSSCRKRAENLIMDQAESLLEHFPDSSLIVLQRIDTAKALSQQEMARYAILNLKAQVNLSQIEINNLSLIDNAIEFYKNSHQYTNLLEATYYKGKALLLNSRPNEAIDLAMQSHYLASKKNNYLWQAKSAELLKDIFDNTMYPAEMLSYANETVYYYGKAGKNDSQRYAICDLAVAYSVNGDYNRAIELLDSVISIAQDNKTDSALISYAYRSKLPVLFSGSKTKDVLSQVQRIRDFCGSDDLSTSDKAMIMKLEIDNGCTKQADELTCLMSEATNIHDSIAVTSAKISLFKQDGDYLNAISLTDSLIDLQKKEFERFQKQSITTAQKDFLSQLTVTIQRIKSGTAISPLF